MKTRELTQDERQALNRALENEDRVYDAIKDSDLTRDGILVFVGHARVEREEILDSLSIISTLCGYRVRL